MLTKVCFAPHVIGDLSFYPGGRLQVSMIEVLLETNPLIGQEYIEGIPAIRRIHRLCEVPAGKPYVGTLAFKYLYLPLADFIPNLNADEILVFEVGRPEGGEMLRLSPIQRKQQEQLVTEIYHTAQITA